VTANGICSAHRQRTQDYIKALEDEILRLRDRESRLVRENEDYACNIDLLRKSLVSNTIPILEAPKNLDTETCTEAAESAESTEIPDSVVTVDITDLQIIEGEQWCSTKAAEAEPRRYESPRDALPLKDSILERPDVPLQQLDTQTGINFILE
jgi:hypothetical protein